MTDSKLIKILRTFSEKEFRDFEKFVDSPYFSMGRDLSGFFKSLKPFYPEFESKNFSTEKIFSILFPEKKFNEKTSGNILHKLSSELFKLTREFMIQTELSKDSSRKYFYLLNQLREKKLYKEFEKEYKNSESETKNTIKGSVNDFLGKYYLKHCFLEYSIERNNVRNAFDSILTLGEYVVIVALIKGFRNIDTNMSAENFNIKNRYNLVDNFMKHLDSGRLLEEMKRNNDKFYPYAAVSYAIHKMCKYPDVNEHYFNFKKLVNEYLPLFGHSERYVLFQTMISYCTRKIESDDREIFIREEFENYKKTIELGIYKFSKTDKIQINGFRTITLSAIDNGEIDWLEEFVKQYNKELDIEHRENMMYYSLAFIYFEKKDYEKALENIMKIKYNFILFKMDVKNLMFKIYYELGYFEQAFSMLDAMKHYASNTNDLSEKFKLRVGNFIKYASKILKIKTAGNKSDVNHLVSELKKEKYIDSHAWLLKKIYDLK